MKAERRRVGGGWIAVLAVTVALAMGAWPAWSQARWSAGQAALHGVPAFFLGGLLWLAGVMLVGFLAGGWREGWRTWLRRGGPRWVGSMVVLWTSFLALFYAVESWRGRQAWGRVTAAAVAAAESLEPRSLLPAEVPAAEDLWHAPLFEPIRRLEAGGNLQRADADLGALAPLLTWAGKVERSAGTGVPGWMTGDSEPPGESPSRSRRLRVSIRRTENAEPRPKVTTGSPTGGEGDSVTEATTRRQRAQEFLKSVEGLEPLLAQAREAAGRAHCRVALEPAFALLTDGGAERVLLALERLAFGRARALLELERNEEALSDLRLGFELARHARDLPGVYVGRRSVILADDGMQALWEGLAKGAWKGTQLGLLEKSLAAQIRDPEVEVRRRLRWVALSSAAFVECMIPTAPESAPSAGRPASEAWMTSDADREVLAWVRRMYPSGWSLQIQAAVLDTWLRQGARWSRGGCGTWTGCEEVLHLLRHTSDPIYPVFVLPKVRQLWEDAEQYPQLETACWRLGATACSIERRWQESGTLPDGLGQEAQEKGNLPTLHYRRVDERTYILHLDGLDGRDDGGDVIRGTPPAAASEALVRSPDWVWTGRVAVPGLPK